MQTINFTIIVTTKLVNTQVLQFEKMLVTSKVAIAKHRLYSIIPRYSRFTNNHLGTTEKE